MIPTPLPRLGRLALCAALLLLLPTGCRKAGEEAGHEHDGDHGHDHGDEPRTAQITVWTDQYEVFAEHQAPVAGRAATVITHVTDLVTLEPRREGPVKFVLRQGDTVAEHPQAGPARAGIYLPRITFPRAGDWQVTLLIPTGPSNAPVELGRIKVYEDAHAAEHANIPEGPEGVSFLKEQQWKILSKAEPVTRRTLQERVRVPAQVRARPGDSARVIAPVAGQLMGTDGRTPQPGQRVEAGQLLARLRPTLSEGAALMAEAGARLATARAELAQASAAYERVKQLAATQAKSAREVEEAEAAYLSARARHTAAGALLATFSQNDPPGPTNAPLLVELRAPIAGTLDSLSAGAGGTVEAGQMIFAIVNPGSVWIEGRVPESAMGRVGQASDATLEIPGQTGPFLPITGEGRGRLVSLGLTVDARTRTVPLLYETSNPDTRLRLGQQVMLHVATRRIEQAVAIPDEAIVEEGDQPIAFVQLSGETFEKRELRTGIRDSGFVEVLAGLKEGERVVTRGAYAIRLSTLMGNIPSHGHAH